MTNLSTAQSYIVRVYRTDSDDPRKLAGQVETLDGSGVKTPFTDADELTALLTRGVPKQRRGKKTGDSVR